MPVLPTPDVLTGTPVAARPRARRLTGTALSALTALLVLLGLMAAPPALAQHAGSIVFILEDDIWIMAADDPATARPVTTDGTADNPYTWPTQDDQGQIIAVRGAVYSEQTLVVVDQSGTPLRAPFRPSGYEGIEQLSSLHALPTGEAVALSLTSSQCGDGSSLCGGSDLQATDGSGTFAAGAYISSGASWYSPTQVVAGLGGELTTYTAGEDAEQLWYDACSFEDDEPCRTGSNPEIDRDLQRLLAIDGGGQADPIAQAIATSQQLFADGQADRVVLATADQFPDALAGAALAGDDGPILYTSGLGPLDPRTRAEIARVTGGDGEVLTLGGDLAVSDQAASEARAAGGDRPCAAPLPSSCRYAGAAREQTAALISATVLAEHPGTTALIARRDVFADAITGGAYAARAGVPILLTHSTFLHPDTEAFLRDNGIDTSVVLGGTAAIDQPTYDAIPTTTKSRAAGSERTGTSVAIARDLWTTGGHAQGGGVLLVNVRHPQGWQTALSAAVVAAVHGMPQLGVEDPPAGLSTAVREHLQGSGLDVIAFGDQVLVSDAQLQEAMQVSG